MKKTNADRSNPVFRETCREIIENKGRCYSISCKKCPFANKNNGYDDSCTNLFDLSVGITEDANLVILANEFLADKTTQKKSPMEILWDDHRDLYYMVHPGDYDGYSKRQTELIAKFGTEITEEPRNIISENVEMRKALIEIRRISDEYMGVDQDDPLWRINAIANKISEEL